MSLVFLKLGGSLITDKNTANKADLPVLADLSRQIAEALKNDPELQLVLGHGSGSFGHHAAHQFQTRQGVRSPEEWLGFAHVWERARALNQIVVENLVKVNVPVMVFSPSSFLTTSNHKLEHWDTTAIKTALARRLIPLLHGDVVIDQKIGGTIVSTEELFIELSRSVTPDRILLSGSEPGVWRNFAKKDEIIQVIDSAFKSRPDQNSMPSASIDVTGGMGSKVQGMLQLVRVYPKIQVSVFSGIESGNIYRSLMGSILGTCIINRERQDQ